MASSDAGLALLSPRSEIEHENGKVCPPETVLTTAGSKSAEIFVLLLQRVGDVGDALRAGSAKGPAGPASPFSIALATLCILVY